MKPNTRMDWLRRSSHEGPLAAQLSIYLGYVHYRILGATFAGLAFVSASFVMVVILELRIGYLVGCHGCRRFFYGMGAAVVGIMVISSYKLSEKIS